MTARRAVKPSLVGLLVAALLVVQMLGLAHRVTHAGHGQDWAAERAADTIATTATTDTTAGASTEVAPRVPGFFAALFAGHAGQRDCDAFDQMSHADVARASAPIVVAEPLPGAPVVFHGAWHIAAQAHGFLARGPPALA